MELAGVIGVLERPDPDVLLLCAKTFWKEFFKKKEKMNQNLLKQISL